MNISKGLQQAYDIQDLTFKALNDWKEQRLNKDGKLVLGEFGAQHLSQLVKAWEVAQERVRIQRNKPLPGSLNHSKQVKKVRPPSPIADLMAYHTPEVAPVIQPDQG